MNGVDNQISEMVSMNYSPCFVGRRLWYQTGSQGMRM